MRIKGNENTLIRNKVIMATHEQLEQMVCIFWSEMRCSQFAHLYFILCICFA